MMILKKDAKGRWVARNTRTLHGLRGSLATFLLQRRRASRCRDFYVAFTDGEEQVLAAQYRKYLATGRKHKNKYALMFLDHCTQECDYPNMVVGYNKIPFITHHNLTERFTVIKPVRLEPRLSVNFF